MRYKIHNIKNYNSNRKRYVIRFIYILIILVIFILGFVVGAAIGIKNIPFVKTVQTEWAIGIYTGKSPFKISSANIKNPVLTASNVTDANASFIADPFMLREKDTWFMFFEVFNKTSNQGDIGMATSKDGFFWKYKKIVVDEDFHLSYPHIFKYKEDFYMVPETSQTKSIRLYKAADFPNQWSLLKILVNGKNFSDPSIFRYANKWWMFSETSPDQRFDTLRLYFADDLMGPWVEHPASPLIKGNPNIARPAGRVITFNEQVFRFTQDDDPVYGKYVRAFEITKLTTATYEEQEVNENPILTPSGTGWNALRMHHIDLHQIDKEKWIACVDGRGEKLVLSIK